MIRLPWGHRAPRGWTVVAVNHTTGDDDRPAALVVEYRPTRDVKTSAMWRALRWGATS